MLQVILFQCSRCKLLNAEPPQDVVNTMAEKELLLKMEPQIQANRRNLPFPRLLAEGILHADKPLAEKEALLRELFGIPLEEGQHTLTEITAS